MAAGAALGVYLVAKQLSGIDLGSVVTTANWAWVLFALVLGVVPNAAQALSITGSVAVPLPYGATVALELSDNFTGLVGGTIGSDASVIRFFQRRGLAASVAVVSTLLVGVARTVSQVVLLGVSYLIVRGDFTMPACSTNGSGGAGSARSWWCCSWHWSSADSSWPSSPGSGAASSTSCDPSSMRSGSTSGSSDLIPESW
jgi:hypothetical protein